MSARNVFVAVMLALVIALSAYLFSSVGTKREKERPVAELSSAGQSQTAVNGDVSGASVGNISAMPKTDAKLKDLKAQQGAAFRGDLSHLYLVKCSACHGRDGRGPVGPPLAGKTREENIAILMKYKMKQVPNSAMLGLLEQTSNQEIEMLAGEIAAF